MPGETLREQAQAVARDFRIGREADANAAFATWTDALLARLDPHALAGLGPALAEIHTAQRRGDTLRVADLLQHVVAPTLTG